MRKSSFRSFPNKSIYVIILFFGSVLLVVIGYLFGSSAQSADVAKQEQMQQPINHFLNDSEIKTYKNEKHGYEIKYIPRWLSLVNKEGTSDQESPNADTIRFLGAYGGGHNFRVATEIKITINPTDNQGQPFLCDYESSTPCIYSWLERNGILEESGTFIGRKILQTYVLGFHTQVPTKFLDERNKAHKNITHVYVFPYNKKTILVQIDSYNKEAHQQEEAISDTLDSFVFKN